MAKVQPSDARITIADTEKGLRIVIPCRRSLFVIGFLGFWLCGWGVAEFMVAKQLVSGDAPPEGGQFMLAWLGVWTLGGGVALYAWLWQMMGKEMVLVHGQTFKIRRDIGGFGFDKEYDMVQMRDLMVGPLVFSPVDLTSSFQLWGIGGGMITFDYGSKACRFGAGLDEAEAKQIVTAVKQRFRIAESSSPKGPSRSIVRNEPEGRSRF